MGAGQLIGGRYRLEESVGAGGNGKVWRAVDEELDRVVALKCALSGDDAQGSGKIRPIRHEAKVLAKLNHPNVVTLHNVVRDGGDWWLVMEYVPRSNLAQLGCVSPARAARIGVQIASALESAHTVGVLHRDVKPSNVLVTKEGHAKLGDFGNSRVTGDDVTLTDTGHVIGTPAYIAPEVANGESPVGASDVFSLGATLFAAVEGGSPYGSADNPLVLLRRAAAGVIHEPTKAGELAPILAKLMAIAPEQRPSAAAARKMLETVAEDGGSDVTPVRVPFSLNPRFRRTAMISGAVVAVLAVIVAVTIVVTNLRGSSSAQVDPASAIGDPRTADPCGLVSAGAYGKYGTADVQDDGGNFNRCDVEVQSGASDVDVKVELDTSDGSAPSGDTRKIGSLTVLRDSSGSDECDRTVLLSKQYEVDVTAQQHGDGDADLCGMADVATNGVVQVVSHGPIPRRSATMPSYSLINTDVCALFGADTLAQFPGVDALHPRRGFGGWSCEWDSTTSSADLQVRFDRNPPLDASDGTVEQLGGHQSFVDPGGDGQKTCVISVVGRQYTDSSRSLTDELMLVKVEGPQPQAQLCQWATAVTGPAAAKLPSA